MKGRIRKWPAYIPPEKDELLSSWLVRLMREHYTRPFTFCSYYFNGYNLMSRDIDKYLPEEITQLIRDYSHLNINEIKNLQLTYFDGIIFESFSESNFVPGISNAGIYHRTKKHNGLLVCGSCIAKKTYFKKSWRLLSSIICSECNSYLTDNCPNCKSPIDFQRHSIGRKRDYVNSDLYLCWNCNYDYRNIHSPVTNKTHQDYQLFVDKTIQCGYNKYTQYSFLYFKVLFLFLQKFRTRTGQWNRIHYAFMSEFQLDNKILSTLDYSSYQLSSLSLRIEILPLIHFLLEDWPLRFVEFAKKHKIRNSDFSKDMKNGELPFWFQQIFIEF